MSEVEQGDRLKGGCSCGARVARSRGNRVFVHCGHCRDCQRQTGSVVAVNALIETACIEVMDGEPVATGMPTSCGDPAGRARRRPGVGSPPS